MRLEGGRLGLVQDSQHVGAGGVVTGALLGEGERVAGRHGRALRPPGTCRPGPEGLPLLVAHAVIPLSSSASFMERSA